MPRATKHLKATPKITTNDIDPEVLVVLRSIDWDGDLARIKMQLDRKLYVHVNKVLESIGGTWDRKLKAHKFGAGVPQEALEALIEQGHYVSVQDLKQVHGEFFTPDELARDLVKLLQIPDSKAVYQVLEPSAGNGQLVRALMRFHSNVAVTAYEIQEKHKDQLTDAIVGDMFGNKHSGMVGSGVNFFDVEPSAEQQFDYVVMNPPFRGQCDVDHVYHAWKFLKPGGRLATIMSPGWTFRTNRKSTAFLYWQQPFVQERIENPEGAFKTSGTNIRTVTLVLDKPL